MEKRSPYWIVKFEDQTVHLGKSDLSLCTLSAKGTLDLHEGTCVAQS